LIPFEEETIKKTELITLTLQKGVAAKVNRMRIYLLSVLIFW